MANHCGEANQLPGEGNGIFFEIIAEGEISQHLEKGVMPVGKTDIFEIVVFSSRPHALLGRGRSPVVALFQAEKDIFELIHPRIGEQQRGVIGRRKRRRMHLPVTLLDKKVQEFAPNFGTGEHANPIRPSNPKTTSAPSKRPILNDNLREYGEPRRSCGIRSPPRSGPRGYSAVSSSRALSVSSSTSHFFRMAKTVLAAKPARMSWRKIRAACF